jgi:hypothetical protein
VVFAESINRAILWKSKSIPDIDGARSTDACKQSWRHSVNTPRGSGLVKSALLAAGLLVCGCDMEEYHKKVLEQQGKVSRLDETEKLLGGSVFLAEVNHTKGGDLELSMRLPRGISSEEGQATVVDKIQYHRFLRDPGIKDCPFQEVDVALPNVEGDDWVPMGNDLEAKVQSRFGLKNKGNARSLKQSGQLKELAVETHTVDQYKGQANASINICDPGETKVVVIFYTDLDKKSDFYGKAIDTVLASLVVGPEARKAWREYEKRKSQTRKGPAGR